MYVCLYVCMYACMHACMRACVCVCVCVCMYVRTSVNLSLPATGMQNMLRGLHCRHASNLFYISILQQQAGEEHGYVCYIMLWYGTVWYGMVWYSTVSNGTVRHDMLLC